MNSGTFRQKHTVTLDLSKEDFKTFQLGEFGGPFVHFD
jgi:hypothetical protein